MSENSDDQFAHVAALRPDRKPAGPERMRAGASAEFDRLAQLLGASVERNRYGEHLVVRRWYSTPEMCVPEASGLRLLLPQQPRQPAPVLARLADADSWLFLDTETTGLAGGTGTYAFLVGLAWWDAGGLQVEQLFMRDYDEEHSLLLELARRMGERRVLVTFNGKSFDWPLLETRYRMTRALAPRAPAAHLDLLHPARHLWRLRLGSVRLTDLERHVLGAEHLGWSRSDDINSSLIPQIYFDYLRGSDPDPLVSIFRHNQMDLRGLAALAGKILGLFSDAGNGAELKPETGRDSESIALELYGLSRLFARRGERSHARRLYESALAAGLPEETDRAARHELARLAKRERNYALATSLWEELVGSVQSSLEACEQLAIYYEHRAGKPQHAAALTRRALADLRKALRAGRLEAGRYHRLEAQFAHRLARLERICSRRDGSTLSSADSAEAQ